MRLPIVLVCVLGLIACSDNQADAPPIPDAVTPQMALSALAQDSIEDTFESVRDNVRFVPYAGVLRGSGGTAIAGAGNALD